jgi:hypothetical protein
MARVGELLDLVQEGVCEDISLSNEAAAYPDRTPLGASAYSDEIVYLVRRKESTCSGSNPPPVLDQRIQ